ncbi:MAG: 16S rRNA (cytidine(1402)-2'-O)-methyltransferase [Candidatus Roizmanbacteria bacterium]
MLYIVGTPIGNLKDLSIRQAETIMSADILLTEDTRSTGILMEKIREFFHLERKDNQRIFSYYKDVEFSKLPEIIEYIETNDVVLISQCGMPLISDPGHLLIKETIKRNLPFTIVPGPTASTTALIASGFSPHPSMYLGFLPKQKNKVKKIIESTHIVALEMKDTTFIAYDSANRLLDTLKIFVELYPEAHICICRELTKQYEEMIRGTATEILQKEIILKGEITLVFRF